MTAAEHYRATLREPRRIEGVAEHDGDRATHVLLQFTPDPAADGLRFVDGLRPDSPMRAFAPAVERGLADAARRLRGGIALVGVRAELLAGTLAAGVDPPAAFAEAAAMALAMALEENRTLLESFAEVDMVVPERDPDRLVAIANAISHRGGKLDRAVDAGGETSFVVGIAADDLQALERDLAVLTGDRCRLIVRQRSWRPMSAGAGSYVLWLLDALAAVARPVKDQP